MRKASIKKNFIMNSILTMSSFIFPLITFPYVSRILQPAGTGKVAFAISFISYFNLIAQLGIPTYGIRECARVRDDRELLSKTAQELVIINLIMSLFAYLCLAIAIFTVPRIYNDRELILVVSVTVFLNAVGMEWLYKALEQYTYIAVRSILFKLIALAAMFAFIHSKDDYIIYGGISVFAASASNIVNLIHSRKHIDLRLSKNIELIRHLRPILVFFAMACATTIYTNLDEVMLGFMTSDIDVGYYDAATKIKKVLVSVVTSLGVVVLPRASYYIEKGKTKEFWDISEKAIHFIFLIASPMMVFFILFAKDTINVLAGSSYGGAVLPMQLLMPTILFIGLTNIMGIQIMVPLGRENKVLHSVILGAVTDALLNALLIPTMGASGAAIGTLAAEAVVLIYQFHVLGELIQPAFKDVAYWKLFISLLLAAMASRAVVLIGVGSFLSVLIGAVIFFSVYLAAIILTKEKLTMELLKDVRLRK